MSLRVLTERGEKVAKETAIKITEIEVKEKKRRDIHKCISFKKKN
jgi:hypothetical protein